MSITTLLCGKRLWIAGLIAVFSIAVLAQTVATSGLKRT